MGEGSLSQLATQGKVCAALPQGLNNPSVVRGVHNDGNVGVVLGRGSNHRWATDVDLLDGFIALCSSSDGLNKWIEVHHDQLEWLDVQVLELVDVIGEAQIRQKPAVNLGVKSLHAAIERLWKTSDLTDFNNRKTCIGYLLGGGACRNNLNPLSHQSFCQIKQASFV